MSKKHRAFTLVEIMIAILFISIGFFGYVALHSRILHSGQRLEEKEVVRASTDFFEAIEVARIVAGNVISIDGEVYPADFEFPGLFRISTSNQNRDTSWKTDYPPEYHPGLEETLELSPNVMSRPHEYSWKSR